MIFGKSLGVNGLIHAANDVVLLKQEEQSQLTSNGSDKMETDHKVGALLVLDQCFHLFSVHKTTFNDFRFFHWSKIYS